MFLFVEKKRIEGEDLARELKRKKEVIKKNKTEISRCSLDERIVDGYCTKMFLANGNICL